MMGPFAVNMIVKKIRSGKKNLERLCRTNESIRMGIILLFLNGLWIGVFTGIELHAKTPVQLGSMETIPLDSSGKAFDLNPQVAGNTLPLTIKGSSSMDEAYAFTNPYDAWGVCLEHLGYRFINPRIIENYAVRKDGLCPRWLDAGAIPIYTADGIQYAYYKNRDPNFPAVREFQAMFAASVPFVVQNIGTIAPLLDRSFMHNQVKMLFTALEKAGAGHIGPTNPLFEEVLRDLSLHYDDYGFGNMADAKEIQEEFGFIVDAAGNVIGVNPTYQQWWDNVHASIAERAFLIQNPLFRPSSLMYRMLIKDILANIQLNR